MSSQNSAKPRNRFSANRFLRLSRHLKPLPQEFAWLITGSLISPTSKHWLEEKPAVHQALPDCNFLLRHGFPSGGRVGYSYNLLLSDDTPFTAKKKSCQHSLNQHHTIHHLPLVQGNYYPLLHLMTQQWELCKWILCQYDSTDLTTLSLSFNVLFHWSLWPCKPLTLP